eukprot:CAMPEP_0197434908 /NCGR_PEP_ID=MMETSP1175-20131217/2561_1 /TAXON_ID=1003142 /ORGANISM="Triceratium dubium, Strain CCMP147" /LENGTH=35 /DNA_ID= /DNA_START= /DNA_END= /DNA_ORIENTATION=
MTDRPEYTKEVLFQGETYPSFQGDGEACESSKVPE